MGIAWVMSLPADLGGTWGDRAGFSAAARPEVLLRTDEDDPPFAVGPYLELGAIAGRFTFGGGGTVAAYSGKYAVAISGGESLVATDTGTFGQPVVSLFVGMHAPRQSAAPLDLPSGVRLDYRPPTHDLPGTFTASVSFDLFIPVLAMALRGL